MRKETTPPPLARKESTPAPAKSASPVDDVSNSFLYLLPSPADNSHPQPDNAQLKAELREAREKIRNLELQLEATKANAKRAAEALLNV